MKGRREGGMEEWRNGRTEERRHVGTEGRRNGGMKGRREGGIKGRREEGIEEWRGSGTEGPKDRRTDGLRIEAVAVGLERLVPLWTHATGIYMEGSDAELIVIRTTLGFSSNLI